MCSTFYSTLASPLRASLITVRFACTVQFCLASPSMIKILTSSNKYFSKEKITINLQSQERIEITQQCYLLRSYKRTLTYRHATTIHL